MTAARVTALIGAAAYAGLLATTRPFTLEADVVTALALAVAVAAVVLRLASARTVRTVPDGTGGAGGTGGTGGTGGARRDQEPGFAGWRPSAPWIVLAGAVVAWELFCFFGGARPAHPTLSSIYDIAARSEAAKAAVVLAWVGLGWALVRA
ncbi:MAG: hypothetical protein ACYDHU_04050 [Acidimicrobiales bacterium]